MRACVATAFGGPENQTIIDLPTPEPGPGQFRVRVHAAGVNPADWKMREGRVGTGMPLPLPMGLELSGTVDAVGPGVSTFEAGDRVAGQPASGHGAFAEYSVLDVSRAVHLPADVSFADAAVMPVAGATAYDGLHNHQIDAGQTLVIIGAGGGVGTLASQIARVNRLTTIGVASESKRDIVESNGAHFIPSGDRLAERVKEAAAGRIHLILDLVGGDTLRELAPLTGDPSAVISAAAGPSASQLGATPIARTPDSLEKIVGMLGFKLIDPQVTSRYPLENAAQAIAHVEEGHTAGKVIIEVVGK